MSSTVYECRKIPEAKGPCGVRFPGGIVIESMPNIGDGDWERGIALFRAMTPALAALAPVFALIGAVLGLKKFVEAFTSFPPDPGDLAEGIDEFLTNVNKLVAVAPPVSVPLLVKDLLTCIVSFLSGVIGVLQELQIQQQRIDAARQKSVDMNLPDLEEMADCAEENLELYLEHVAATMGSLGTLFAVLQSFADVAGLDLPGVDFDVSGGIDDALDKLGEIVFTLSDILEALP